VALKGSKMGNTVQPLVRTAVPALLLGVPAVLLALAAPACVDNNVTLFIQQVQVPDPENSCSVSADPGAAYFPIGYMDTSLTSQYAGALLIGNQLASRGDSTTLRPESNRVQLYEADVEIFDAGGGSMSAFTMPISGFVEVSSATEPAYGIAYVTLIDAGTGAALAGQQTTVITRVKVYGETLGGLAVETGYWDFPIQICSGCIQCICPSGIDAEYAKTCNPGQNSAVDCRLQACWGTTANCGCATTV
jgi:hypothetical protein